jgi:hypothetical protein
MWFFAMLTAVAAVAVSFERLRRVRGAVSFDVAALAQALGRAADANRLSEMGRAMAEEGASWERDLVRTALDNDDPAVRLALVNELLGDVGSALGWGSRIPSGAARLAALGPLCLAFTAIATRSAAPTGILPVIAWGGAGLVGALAVGREADRVAAELRAAIDMWVARVLEAAAKRGNFKVVDPPGGDV